MKADTRLGVFSLYSPDEEYEQPLSLVGVRQLLEESEGNLIIVQHNGSDVVGGHFTCFAAKQQEDIPVRVAQLVAEVKKQQAEGVDKDERSARRKKRGRIVEDDELEVKVEQLEVKVEQLAEEEVEEVADDEVEVALVGQEEEEAMASRGVDGGGADAPASPPAASPAAGRAVRADDANHSLPRRSPRMEVGLGLGKRDRRIPDPKGAIPPSALPLPLPAAASTSASAAAASGSGSASTSTRRVRIAGIFPPAPRCLNISTS